jgi:hypothetical protein
MTDNDADAMRLTRRTRWGLLAGAAGLAAVFVTETAASAAWRTVTGREPPDDPADSGGSLADELLWAAGLAAVVALAQVGARRAAAGAWTLALGTEPPRRRRRKRRRLKA